MSDIETRLNTLASSFAADVVAVIREASIKDFTNGTGGRAKPAAVEKAAVVSGRNFTRTKVKKGRLPRRSEDDIQKTSDDIVALLRKSPKGLRAEEIRTALKIDKRELPKPLALALGAKSITKKGQKRATTYLVR